MGSRFEGTIHGEAMPWLNRHVGNPILTGMLNVLFGVKISDAHCGMRAVRRDALPTLDLHSTGMEFASEMVFKAFRRKLSVSEIPIDYYPRVGESKLNRFGDAWRHVKFMLLYSPSWLYFVPGADPARARRGRHDRARSRARRRLRPHVADPHAASSASRDPARHAGRPARRLRARLRARPPRRDATRSSSGPTAGFSLEHGLRSGRAPAPRGLVTLRAIFVSWALAGFGALSARVRDRASASRSSRSACRSCSVVLPQPPDDAHDEPSRATSSSASPSHERLRPAQRAAARRARPPARAGPGRRPATRARRRLLVRLPRPPARRARAQGRRHRARPGRCGRGARGLRRGPRRRRRDDGAAVRRGVVRRRRSAAT